MAVVVEMVLVLAALGVWPTVMETLVLLVERFQAVVAVRAGHKLMPLVAQAVLVVLTHRLVLLVLTHRLALVVLAGRLARLSPVIATSLIYQQGLGTVQLVKGIK